MYKLCNVLLDENQSCTFKPTICFSFSDCPVLRANHFDDFVSRMNLPLCASGCSFLHIFSPCFSTGIGKDNDCFETVVEQGNREQWWRNVDGGVTMATEGQRVFQLWESKHIFYHCFYSEFWAALVTFRVRDKSANCIWPRGAVPSLQKLKDSWQSHIEIQTGVQVSTFSINLCYWIA